MKKSEMTVSMPLTSWQEYEKLKSDYFALQERLRNCFDISLFELQKTISFDASKSLAICKELLPISFSNAPIEMRV